MKRLLSLDWLAALAMLCLPEIALAQRAEYEALVATHARANGGAGSAGASRDRA